MIRTIRKRDGRHVEYDRSKIETAICKAFAATGEAKAFGKPGAEAAPEQVARSVEDRLLKTGLISPSVEQIQDVVESTLIDFGYITTARAYIVYRSERTRIREMNTGLMKTYEEIAFRSALDCDSKRENANIDADTPMGAMLKYGSEGAKKFYEMFVIDPRFVAAHRAGDIHIHDLDFYSLTTTCCQIDIKQLFANGFSTGHGVLREPNDIASYSALACIAIQSNQNDQHGGQSIVNFDYGMADGVAKTYAKRYREALLTAFELLIEQDRRKEVENALSTLQSLHMRPSLADDAYYEHEMSALLSTGFAEGLCRSAQTFARRKAVETTERAVYQAMEAFIHNLNTMHSRAGAQTPFSSINYGMDTSPEGRLATRSILLATEAGLGGGETPIFPIQIFRVKRGVNFDEGEPNYDLFRLACRVSSKRLFPNFSFLDAPFNAQYYVPGRPETEVAYMGCRTRVLGNAHAPDRQISNGRGNLSFTTVNLPRLAIKARNNVSSFITDLDARMTLIIDQLLERLRIQSGRRVYNYPFLMGQGVWIDSEKLGWTDEVGDVLKHGTLSLGFIGLAEALKALTGAHHGESEASQALGLDIVRFMRERLDRESQARRLNFTLLATPAEGLAGRFVPLDREEFGEIAGVTDRDYYTNSFHVPVYQEISAGRKIEIEAPYHALTNAGHITYVELDGDPSQNPQAFESIVRFMADSGIGYGSINHPVDRDPVCGYNGVIGDRCPRCGRGDGEGGVPFQRIRRITGYLVGTLDRWGNAKRAEERDREKHSLEPLGGSNSVR